MNWGRRNCSYSKWVGEFDGGSVDGGDCNGGKWENCGERERNGG